MATTKRTSASLRPKNRRKPVANRPGLDNLGLRTLDPLQVVHWVRAGFPFHRLARFQRVSQLSWERIARFTSIRKRTLHRRQSQGRLLPDESDRVLRASAIFDMAVALFEGDVAAAKLWLETPQPALAGEAPIEFAATEVGAREVERLIARLEHGVFP